MIPDWVYFYAGLILGVGLDLLAIWLSFKNKHKILSWILLINFGFSVFFPDIAWKFYSYIISPAYLIYLFFRWLYKKIKPKKT